MVKNRLKDDIRFMLSNLVKSFDDAGEDYNSLISEIYDELDNLSLVDLCVTREYIKDSVSALNSSKQFKKPKKSMLAARLKVISDNVGNFYVVSEDGGQEKIVFQTSDKNRADQFVRDNQKNAAVAAAPEDELEGDVSEDIAEIPEDDLPNTRTDKNDTDDEDEDSLGELDDEEEELNGEEEDEVDQETLDEIEELIERADHLIAAIDNSIDVVPDLDAITDLVNIKVSIQDRVDELNSKDPAAPDLDEAMEALRSELEEYESKALDIINKNTPNGEEDKEEEEEAEDTEPVEESTIIKGEEELPDDETDEEESPESEEDELELDEEFDDSGEEFEDVELDSEEEPFGEDTEELNEEELSEDNIDELIDDLLSSVEDLEEKIEDVREIVEEKKQEKDIEEVDLDTDSKDTAEGEEELGEELSEETPEEESAGEDEEDKTLASSALTPPGWESLEDGEVKDSELESDTPTSKMVPEDDGVAEVGRKKPDKKPCGELPLDGVNPLEAKKAAKR
jgi:hypothetical protein